MTKPIMQKRVVVTGIGGITALGDSWQSIKKAFQKGENAVQFFNVAEN